MSLSLLNAPSAARRLGLVSLLALALCAWSAVPAAPRVSADADDAEVQLKKARVYWEYNATDNDLGVHVLLDGDHWRRLTILKPSGSTLFKVEGRGPYAALGMTELFFEGAEPSLDEVPLEDLLAKFPEGTYEFEGRTVDGAEIEGEAVFSHAIPAGPVVAAQVLTGAVVISWLDVTTTPEGFPEHPIAITGYQVIAGSFQVTLPAWANQVTLPPEFVSALGAGTHEFEVLAIEASGNQTLTASTFTLP